MVSQINSHTRTQPRRITAVCTLGTQTRIHTSKTPTMHNLKYSGPRQRVGQFRAHDPRGSHARGLLAGHAAAPIREAPGPATDQNGGRGPRPGEAAPGLAPVSGAWGPGRRRLVCVLPRPQARRPGSASRPPLASQAAAKEARGAPGRPRSPPSPRDEAGSPSQSPAKPTNRPRGPPRRQGPSPSAPLGPQRLPPLPLAGPRCTSSRTSAAAAPPPAEPAEPPPPTPHLLPNFPRPRRGPHSNMDAERRARPAAGQGRARLSVPAGQLPRLLRPPPAPDPAARRPPPAARRPPPAARTKGRGRWRQPQRQLPLPGPAPSRHSTAPRPREGGGRGGTSRGGEGPAEAGRGDRRGDRRGGETGRGGGA